MSHLDIALIGAGRMGQVHGPNAARSPGLRVKYVVDPREDLARALAARTGAAVATLGHALDDPQIGGVLVCSSTDRHLEQSLAALEKGKAVFCEKPVDLDPERARRALPRFEGARFVLGFNRRYDPHFLALKRQLDGGAIGSLESLHIVNHDPAAPPAGFIPTSGGLFKDFTIHDLDLARWLLDEEPIELFTAASCLVDPEIGRLGDVDTARTVLKTASGRLCVISNTRRSGCGYDQRVEAFGSRGMLAAGNPAHNTVRTLTEAGEAVAPIAGSFVDRYVDSYRNQMAHFCEVAHGRAQPRTGFADGLAALVLAQACQASAEGGRTINLREWS